MKQYTFYLNNERNGAFNTDANVVAVKTYEAGYYPIYTRLTAEKMNKGRVPDDVL